VGRNYERATLEVFGSHLLASGDLDPIYVALHEMALPRATLARWLLAYSCFYSAGVACFAAEHEGEDFWSVLLRAALNEEPTPAGNRWERGHERRHARGKQGINMVLRLRERYGDRPEGFIDAITGDTCGDVMKRVRKHYLYGQWIGFKMADLLDRVVGHPVSFNEAAIFVFKDPVKAAHIVYAERNGLDVEKVTLKVEGLNAVIDSICEHFADWDAPPLYDRPIGLQEAETILCKYKSMLNGHYPPFNDIDEINSGLAPWLDHSALAGIFLSAMPARHPTPEGDIWSTPWEK
jgi:hypothetical protein